MLLLDIPLTIEILIHIGELILGICGIVGVFYKLQNKVELQGNDFDNFKENTRDNLTKLENNMNSAYSKVENKIGELENKMALSHKELTDKIEKLPESIASIFKSLK